MTINSIESLRMAILEAVDPFSQESIGDVADILELSAEGSIVRLKLAFRYPVETIIGELSNVLSQALADVPGVTMADVEIVWRVVRANILDDGSPLSAVKNIIAVSSGKGGVGKSTTAVNLALALAAEGANVGILDADIYGPSLPMMLGVADGTRPEIEDEKFFKPVMAHGLQTMSMGYLVNEQTPMVWRGPMAGGALKQLVTQTLWQDVDYLIIDMPPGTGDIQLTLSQTVPVSGAVIVTTPQDIALLDAQKGVEMFRKVSVPVLGMIENMAIHVCSNCGHKEHIFGSGGGQKMAELNQVPLLGSLPLAMSIREQADSGNPTVSADIDSDLSLYYRSIAYRMIGGLASEAASKAAAAPTISVDDD
ncbi:MAG: iron-sulfur cluster carrier protein ApbC [Moraxellaceae bacterium]|nr:MAG: iron-sulfur cluster carrier protein ApbC [Moraxellaceae bacterium]